MDILLLSLPDWNQRFPFLLCTRSNLIGKKKKKNNNNSRGNFFFFFFFFLAQMKRNFHDNKAVAYNGYILHGSHFPIFLFWRSFRTVCAAGGASFFFFVRCVCLPRMPFDDLFLILIFSPADKPSNRIQCATQRQKKRKEKKNTVYKIYPKAMI